MLDPDMLADLCPLDNGRHDDGRHASSLQTFSLGSLDILPAEILQDMLVERLDLATLTTLRQVSRSLRRSVDELPQYRTIVTHAPGSLRAALCLEVASSFTCRALYTALCARTCYNYGKFGAYLYVPTCSRACFRCFTEDQEFLPMTKEHAKIFWSITSRDMDTAEIRVARSIPVFYSAVQPRTAQRGRLQLVNYFDAADVSMAVHGSDERINAVGDERERQRLARWQEKLQVWHNTPEGQRPRNRPSRPAYSTWQDDQKFNTLRFMCVVPMPCYNRTDNTLEWGVACNGCKLPPGSFNTISRKDFLDGHKKQQVLYSKREYVGHVTLCEKAQEIFKTKVKDEIACEAKLFPHWHPLCHLVSDLSQREPHPTVPPTLSAQFRAERCEMERERLRRRPREPRALPADE